MEEANGFIWDSAEPKGSCSVSRVPPVASENI